MKLTRKFTLKDYKLVPERTINSTGIYENFTPVYSVYSKRTKWFFFTGWEYKASYVHYEDAVTHVEHITGEDYESSL